MEPETTAKQFRESPTSAQLVLIGKLRRQLTGLMRVDVHEIMHPPDQVIAFRGQIYGDTGSAFEQISHRFAGIGYTAWLNDLPGGGHEVVVTKGVVERKPERMWINVLLFLATLLSVLFIGMESAMQEAGLATAMSVRDFLLNLYRGLPFAGTLMTILLAHELSHYFVARRYGSPVSLPYFVPMPASILGTMGAVIFQRGPMHDRKALFDIGIAGPLAGLVVAIPLLIGGLMFTKVVQPDDVMADDHVQQRLQVQCEDSTGLKAAFCGMFLGQEAVSVREGNSLAYIAAKYLVFGRMLPDENGEDVWLAAPLSPGGPVAFAAWAGLLVTALNLLPIGQLDGGHVAYALLGRRAWKLAYATIGLLGLLGGYLMLTNTPAATTWFVWAGLGMLIGPRHPPPLNDATHLGKRRTALGILSLVILVVIFVPIPLMIGG